MDSSTSKPRPRNAGALAGVRIMDLTRALAGPFGSMILADLGAEVIKIEEPTVRGREIAGKPRVSVEDLIAERSGGGTADTMSLCSNRGKKSMVVDLKTQAGKAVFYDLARTADIVLDNYRPDVPKRLGIDYDTLRAMNPRIICCSISGFGATGPYSKRPAYDVVIQAMSGGMSITGEPGCAPCRAGVPINDEAAGVFAVCGILAALYAREQTGVGQKVDCSLLGVGVSLMSYLVANYLNLGIIPGPMGSGGGHGTAVQGAYQTKDSYIVVAGMGFSNFWESLCRAWGREELATDPRYDSREKRTQHKDELEAIARDVFLTKTTDEWLKLLQAADIPYSRVNTVVDVASDPQVLHENMVVAVDSRAGPIKMVGNPIKLSGMTNHRLGPPPTLGQHTDEILSGLLRYSPEKIKALRKEKAVA